MHVGRVAPAVRISASTRRPSSSSTSPKTTWAPSRANSFASAAPCPRAPPLISATFLSSLPIAHPSYHMVIGSLRAPGMPGALAPTTAVELDQNAVGVVDEDTTDLPLCVREGFQRRRKLNALGDQLRGQGLDVSYGK